MSSPSSQTIRRYIVTASVAAITVTGAWYGAGIKTRQEFKQEKNVAVQATAAERIATLEAKKGRLMNHRAELQSKIDRLAAESSATVQGTHEQSG